MLSLVEGEVLSGLMSAEMVARLGVPQISRTAKHNQWTEHGHGLYGNAKYL